MKIRTFRDLLVWQKGMDLASAIITSTNEMPRSELFAMTSQMRRAASSVPMNIAEGFGKHTRPAFIHGLRTAMGSLFELMTAYELTVRVKFLSPKPEIQAMLEEEDRMLQSLIMRLESKQQTELNTRPTRTARRK